MRNTKNNQVSYDSNLNCYKGNQFEDKDETRVPHHFAGWVDKLMGVADIGGVPKSDEELAAWLA
jgi:hypothetical protein